MVCDYNFFLSEIVCQEEKNLTLDDLEGKMETWKKLRTSLLPCMRSQINITLIRSPDLSEDAIHPCPSPQSTANILSEIHITLGEARTAIEIPALDPLLPSESHDRNIKVFK